jgi:hypothetical protein
MGDGVRALSQFHRSTRITEAGLISCESKVSDALGLPKVSFDFELSNDKKSCEVANGEHILYAIALYSHLLYVQLRGRYRTKTNSLREGI